MPRLPPSVVGDTFTSEHAWDTLVDLVEVGNRMAGQEGEREGAAIVERAFEDAGLRDVGNETFDVPGWWRGPSSLAVGEGGWSADHHVIALPGTPAGTVEAPIVDVGHGMPAEIRDALTDGYVRELEVGGRWHFGE